jgi:competence protein ComFC
MSMRAKWFQKAEHLLSPSLNQCLICNKRYQGTSQLPNVCPSCAYAVPWINTPRCTKCGRHVGCPDCNRSSASSPLLYNRSAVAYNSVMRELIGQYKYRGNEQYALLLGLMLDRAYGMLKAERDKAIRVTLNQRRIPTVKSIFTPRSWCTGRSWQADLLVPVPVSDSRLIERGFNQAERLGHVLSLRRSIPQLPLLVRTHHTGKQSFKSRAERLSDMTHAFAADPGMKDKLASWLHTRPHFSNPLQIIIIDDIYTTGSTIRSCADALQSFIEECQVAAEIYSLTLARS